MKKILFILIALFSYPFVSYGADVSLTVPDKVTIGEVFQSSLKINTGGVTINSIEITVAYPQDILTFKGYQENGSIRKIWLTAPVRTENGIHFSAIIPGGVDGLYDPDKSGLQPIPIVDLLFFAQKEGEVDLRITHSQILENDGLGTPFSYNIKNASTRVLPQATGASEITEPKDKVLPESLNILFVEAGIFSKTPSMVVFWASDVDSGIDKYQILSKNGAWRDVSSPLPISKSLLKKEVILRAVDFGGNTREATTTIPGLFSGYQLFITICAGIICYFLFFMVKKRR